MSFESNPPGADCALERNGVAIGNVRTPGGIVVEKTKHNIKVTCRKEGYQDATAHLKSEVAGATFGNIILGGGIGWAIDSASGADNKYQEITTVTLIPLSAAPAPAPASTPAPTDAVGGTQKSAQK
ncbi:PEGA domain-containing protein [uncultured Ferrovibrio sp.]|uniref:PEGA domain-containing protein n=1 Tax=uncultured Ferrovibrio sp. TaxID=1576913 RepID=UPI0026358CE7|nr:PEGA domain-containing protein [uncultured Ferrovibrio sp.]